MYLNEAALVRACEEFRGSGPFDHAIVDDFFLPDVAEELEKEFPPFDSACWYSYDNAIEIKKACNNWNLFPPTTYRIFSYLNSAEFVEKVAKLLGITSLFADPGLNGGGWHTHAAGGRLNAHLDYNLHPKLPLQRKLNIIVYLNRNWDPSWGGQLGFWSQGEHDRRPGELVRTVDPIFNRAVLFDTTQTSWHGLARPLACPADRTRNSLAVYYLVPPPPDTEKRGKALFAPSPEQEADQEVLELIRRRADNDLAATVYLSSAKDGESI